jgi:hypothetical protein
MKLNLPRRTKKRVITRERQPLVAPESVNQIWCYARGKNEPLRAK